MNKPKMKQKVSFDFSNKDAGIIFFCADAEDAKRIAEFGEIKPGKIETHHYVAVDGRYDFNEVVEFVKALAEQVAFFPTAV